MKVDILNSGSLSLVSRTTMLMVDVDVRGGEPSSVAKIVKLTVDADSRSSGLTSDMRPVIIFVHSALKIIYRMFNCDESETTAILLKQYFIMITRSLSLPIFQRSRAYFTNFAQLTRAFVDLPQAHHVIFATKDFTIM